MKRLCRSKNAGLARNGDRQRNTHRAAHLTERQVRSVRNAEPFVIDSDQRRRREGRPRQAETNAVDRRERQIMRPVVRIGIEEDRKPCDTDSTECDTDSDDWFDPSTIGIAARKRCRHEDDDRCRHDRETTLQHRPMPHRLTKQRRAEPKSGNRKIQRQCCHRSGGEPSMTEDRKIQQRFCMGRRSTHDDKSEHDGSEETADDRRARPSPLLAFENSERQQRKPNRAQWHRHHVEARSRRTTL